MNFAASLLLGFLAISAAQGRGLNPWEQKAHDLGVKFEKVVDRKAHAIIEKIKVVVHHAQDEAKNFVKEVEREMNATVTQALKAIDILKLEASLECYENATRDIYAAQQAAAANLMGCQNLSIAYQDIKQIAGNASVVVLDVVKDAKVIIEGVAECRVQIGIAKWKCVFKYVTEEIKLLVSQWPDAKRFITVVERLGNDAALQINTCLDDPTQQSLDEKLEEALAEFSACSRNSTSHFDSYVV